MELSVVNLEGKETGSKAQFSEEIFGFQPVDHAIYLDVKQYLANQRQGTHKSKERAEIAGSTKKIKKQKGTGTARAGSIKSPVFRGGGRVFGPRPRNYNFKLNKKLKIVARKSALSYKMKDESITVVDSLNINEVKTKRLVTVLNSLSLSESKVLMVLAKDNNNVYLSSRNLPNVNVVNVNSLNTYDIINATRVVVEEGSIARIEEILN